MAAGGGVLRGEHMLAGFIAIKPDNEIARQMQLLANVNDPAHVERYREFEDWFKHTQAIPGAFYLWIVEHLFRDNELIAGDAGDRRPARRPRPDRVSAEPARRCHRSHHATRSGLRAGRLRRTPPDGVLRDTTTGGHLGLFMGHEALSDHWPPLLAAVRGRSASAASLTWRSNPDPWSRARQ